MLSFLLNSHRFRLFLSFEAEVKKNPAAINKTKSYKVSDSSDFANDYFTFNCEI